jgi:hypothetical protein
MSLSVFFCWDTPGHPFAGSVPSYDGIADEADPLLDKPAAAEQWAARQLLDPALSGWRREALEHFLYVLLRRPDGATRLIEEDRDFEGAREPTVLARSVEVAKRFTKLSRSQKAREHLLLDFESLFRSPEDDPERNDKLAILCELLLDHPAEDAPKQPKKPAWRKAP